MTQILCTCGAGDVDHTDDCGISIDDAHAASFALAQLGKLARVRALAREWRDGNPDEHPGASVLFAILEVLE